MKIAIGSDERTHLTDFVVHDLQAQKHEVLLFGPLAENDPEGDWPLVSSHVAEAVASGQADQGIVRNVTAFPLQVRVAYAMLLAAGLWAPLQWIHLIQLVGTTARVLVGYCLLARTLSLAPWNRRQPLTWSMLRRTFFSPQTAAPPCGAIFDRLSMERVPS